MIFRWIFLLLFALALPCTALAGSYRVIFGGAITRIDDGAPDSSSIGERVLGTYEFSTEPEWTFSVSVISRPFYVISPSTGDPILAGTPFGGSGVFGAGPLTLITEGGFAATDSTSEVSTFWSSPSSTQHQTATGTIRNRTRYDGLLNTLHTSRGPIATGIHLSLNSFDLSPALVADDLGREGELRRVSKALFDPDIFPGITEGVILFGSTSPINVHFDIDTLRIVVIPEPATLGLLLFAMVAVGAGRRTSR